MSSNGGVIVEALSTLNHLYGSLEPALQKQINTTKAPPDKHRHHLQNYLKENPPKVTEPAC